MVLESLLLKKYFSKLGMVMNMRRKHKNNSRFKMIVFNHIARPLLAALVEFNSRPMQTLSSTNTI